MKQLVVTLMLLVTVSFTYSQTWQPVGDEDFIATGGYLNLEVHNNTQYVALRNPVANVMKYDPTFFNGWRPVGNADLSAGLADYLSLDFGNNIPYLAYADGSNARRATVMKLESGTWTQLGQPLSTFEARYIDIALDGDRPYAVYRDVALMPGDVVVKSYNGSYWDTVGVFGNVSDGESSYSKIEIINGVPFIAYKDYYNGGGITVKRLNGADWDTVGEQSFSGDAYFVEFTHDGTTPYVAFRDASNGGKASVMMFDGADWQYVGTPGFSDEAISSIDIEIHGGKPFVVLSNSGFGVINATLLEFDGTNWVQVGDSGFNDEDANSVQLAFVDDFPVVAYTNHLVETVVQLCSPLNTAVSQSGTTLTADEDNALEYKWGLCQGGSLSSVIDGETNQTFTPGFLPNAFAVEINYLGCIDTSSCITVEDDVTGIEDYNSFAFKVYPNPVREQLNIELIGEENNGDVDVSVFDLRGQVVLSWSGVVETIQSFDVSKLANGTYLLQVTTNGEFKTTRFVKE